MLKVATLFAESECAMDIEPKLWVTTPPPEIKRLALEVALAATSASSTVLSVPEPPLNHMNPVLDAASNVPPEAPRDTPFSTERVPPALMITAPSDPPT